MGAENYADYRAVIHDPATVHGMIEDYRAGLAVDRTHDEEDRIFTAGKNPERDWRYQGRTSSRPVPLGRSRSLPTWGGASS
jgi:hypothetical protein